MTPETADLSTPRPWTITASMGEAYDANGKIVLWDISQEPLALIVKAVNAHDALLEAAKASFAGFDFLYREERDPGDRFDWQKQLEMLRATIALAEGEKE